MRYSTSPRTNVVELDAADTHAALFERVEHDLEASERVCMVLLVGGVSREHALLRHAQARTRFDALPSRWSHAALVADWTGSWRDAVGLEVTHEPEAPAAHDPACNGVTPFKLSRYADARRYPSLAVVSYAFKHHSTRYEGASAARAEILGAALEPNRDRARYPLWRRLGPWLSYFYDPDGENPLARGVAMPSASFCQYVFESAGVDTMPAASVPGACPELLWASALRWTEGMDVGARIWRSVATSAPREPEAPPLDDALPSIAALREACLRKASDEHG